MATAITKKNENLCLL